MPEVDVGDHENHVQSPQQYFHVCRLVTRCGGASPRPDATLQQKLSKRQTADWPQSAGSPAPSADTQRSMPAGVTAVATIGVNASLDGGEC